MRFQAVLLPLSAVLLLASPTVCMAQAGPGPEHEKLKEMVGTWDSEMIAPGAPASKGQMTFKMALGGMWLESDFKGDFAGQEFSGKGMDSYDAAQKEYVSVWMDSMTGYATVFRGNYDKSGKVMTMLAEGVGPDGSAVKMKSVSTTEDDDHMTFKMYIIAGGSDVEIMTIKYTRRK
jgi:Protein of unknown function (DUF1579)